jgi:hypothetical protein
MTQPNPERPGQRDRNHHDDDGCHQPGIKTVIRLAPGAVTIHVPEAALAKPSNYVERFPTAGISLHPIPKTILIFVFLHKNKDIRSAANWQSGNIR